MHALPLTVSQLTLDGKRVLRDPVGPLWETTESLLSKGPAVVLGPFGSGKTHLVHRLALGACTTVPLRLLDPDQPLRESVLRIIGARRLELAQTGERPLLFDGLDEARFQGDTLDARFEELLEFAGPRWLLTSRPGFFRTDAEASCFQADSLRRGIPTLHIDPLPRDVVEDQLGSLGGHRLVESVDGLSDLATSPLLLHVVASALEHIHPGRPLQAWGLFDAWIRQTMWTGPDHADAIERLFELAWQVSVHHGFSPTGVRFDGDLVRRLRIPGPLRASLMVTDLDGKWRFGHRSVLEFLLAGYLAPRIADNQGRGPDAISGFLLSEATRAFLVGRMAPMPVTFAAGRVRVPRGNFVSGDERFLEGRPLQVQHLDEPVWIARQPVVHRQWAEFLDRHPDPREDATYLAHLGPSRVMDPSRDRQPIYNLLPSDADAFASDVGARLPTANEWEKAVRGIDGRRWPWGDHWRPGRAVTADLPLEGPLPVRAFGTHGDAGLSDAVGGAFEITATPFDPTLERGRVVMGGSFRHDRRACNPGLRLSHTLSGNLKAGMRLAWDAE